MKPTITHRLCCTILMLLVAAGNSLFAQAWTINGNANIAAGTNYLGTSDPNDLVMRTNALERMRLFGVGGAIRFGSATNNAQIDSIGRLTFTGQGAYRVGGNKYAFQYSGDPDYGLFFNSTLAQYEFRNGVATAVFFVNANTGAGTFASTLKVGAYTLPSTDGASNQVLKTNGAGVLTWSNDNNTSYSAGSGLSLAGTTFTNTAPDQVVALTGSNGITTSGTYPNFTINGAGLWRATGNAGTTPGANFIGTTDAVGFSIKTNNLERIRIGQDGRVGIGTNSPTAWLHVNAAVNEDALRIQTNGTTRLFIDNTGGISVGSLTPGPVGGMFINGNLGVGIAAPTDKIHIAGDATGITFDGGQYIRDVTGIGFSDIQIHANFVPDNTNSHSLGTSTNEWTEVWAIDGSINLTSLSTTKNVKTSPYGIKEIMKLRPVIYNRNSNPEGGDGVKRLGLIAEELKSVVPEAVKDWAYQEDEKNSKVTKVATGKLGVSLNNIIPVLIKGMQDQQNIIAEQNRKIDALTKLVEELYKTKAASNTPVQSDAITGVRISTAILEQNIPNPLNGTTSIRYNIPSGSKNASLLITDMNGKSLKQIPLYKIGSGVVTIDASTFANGTYTYSLLIDGKQIDTKKMIIAR